MTEFEVASLAVARSQMWAATASAIIAVIAAGVGITALWRLVAQVRAAVEANSIGQLNALLLLEQDMSRRRERVGKLTNELTRIKLSPDYIADQKTMDPIILEFEEATENYLNSLDRLCFCILRNKFSEEELRSDYRDVVKRAVGDFPNQFLAGSPFRNIVKLHDRWADM